MLAELRTVLETTPTGASRAEYAAAIIEANCVQKPTTASRHLTNQRLGELYALDPSVALFRVLRRLWDRDAPGRPLLALLAALARDPLLVATAPVVLALPEGGDLRRGPLTAAIRAAVGERLNDATLDKVVRNAASSWTQSGHLTGRTFKTRRIVQPTAAALAFALFLAHAAGFQGDDMLHSGWTVTLDCTAAAARGLAVEAKRLGLIDLRAAGDVFEVDLARLDLGMARS
jgi:hypothetical protein